MLLIIFYYENTTFFISRQLSYHPGVAKCVKSSVVVYSVADTAKANSLIVEKYLVYLFEILVNAEVKESYLLEKCVLLSKKISNELCVKTTK